MIKIIDRFLDHTTMYRLVLWHLIALLGATAVPTLSNPIALVVGALVGFWLPRFWLGRRHRAG